MLDKALILERAIWKKRGRLGLRQWDTWQQLLLEANPWLYYSAVQCEARFTVYSKIYSAKKDLHTTEYKDFKSLYSVVCKSYIAL